MNVNSQRSNQTPIKTPSPSRLLYNRRNDYVPSQTSQYHAPNHRTSANHPDRFTSQITPDYFRTPAGGIIGPFDVTYPDSQPVQSQESVTSTQQKYYQDATPDTNVPEIFTRLDQTSAIPTQKARDRITDVLMLPNYANKKIGGNLGSSADGVHTTYFGSSINDASRTRLAQDDERQAFCIVKRSRIWALASLAYPLQVVALLSIILCTLFLTESYFHSIGSMALRIVFLAVGLGFTMIHLSFWIFLTFPHNLDMSTSIPEKNQILNPLSARLPSFLHPFIDTVKNNGIVRCIANYLRWYDKVSDDAMLLCKQRLLTIGIVWTHLLIVTSIQCAITLSQPSLTMIHCSLILSIFEFFVMFLGTPKLNYETSMWILNLLDPFHCPLWNVVESTLSPLVQGINDSNLMKYPETERILYLSKWNSFSDGWTATVPWLAMNAPAEAIKDRISNGSIISLVRPSIHSLNATIRSAMIGILTSHFIYRIPSLNVFVSALALIVLFPHAILSYVFNKPWDLDADPNLPLTLVAGPSGIGPLLIWIIVSIALCLTNRLCLREYRQLMVLSDKEISLFDASLNDATASDHWANKIAAFSNLCVNLGASFCDRLPNQSNSALFGGYLTCMGPLPVQVENNNSYISSVYSIETQRLVKNISSLVIAAPTSSSLVDTSREGIESRDTLYNLWQHGTINTPVYIKPWYCPAVLWSVVVAFLKLGTRLMTIVQIGFVYPFEYALSLYLLLERSLTPYVESSYLSNDATIGGQADVTVNSKIAWRSTKEAVAIAFMDAFSGSLFNYILSYINGYPVREAIRGGQAGVLLKGSELDATSIDNATDSSITSTVLRMAGTGAMSIPAISHIDGATIVHPYLPNLLLSSYRISLDVNDVIRRGHDESLMIRMGSTLASRNAPILDALWQSVTERTDELLSIFNLLAYLFNNSQVVYTPPPHAIPNNTISEFLNGPRQLQIGEVIYKVDNQAVEELRHVGSVYRLSSGENPYDLFFYGHYGVAPATPQLWSFRFDLDGILLTKDEYERLVSLYANLLNPAILMSSVALSAMVNLTKTAKFLENSIDRSCRNKNDAWLHELDIRCIPRKIHEYKEQLSTFTGSLLSESRQNDLPIPHFEELFNTFRLIDTTLSL